MSRFVYWSWPLFAEVLESSLKCSSWSSQCWQPLNLFSKECNLLLMQKWNCQLCTYTAWILMRSYNLSLVIILPASPILMLFTPQEIIFFDFNFFVLYIFQVIFSTLFLVQTLSILSVWIVKFYPHTLFSALNPANYSFW